MNMVDSIRVLRNRSYQWPCNFIFLFDIDIAIHMVYVFSVFFCDVWVIHALYALLILVHL
jgi:hypothetical protein